MVSLSREHLFNRCLNKPNLRVIKLAALYLFFKNWNVIKARIVFRKTRVIIDTRLLIFISSNCRLDPCYNDLHNDRYGYIIRRFYSSGINPFDRNFNEICYEALRRKEKPELAQKEHALAARIKTHKGNERTKFFRQSLKKLYAKLQLTRIKARKRRLAE